MENQAKQNPLFKHFRQPSIYLNLPTKGKFWKDEALDMPPNGEIPVYPMTTKDELTLKTPDALMNGAGVVNVIQSCCPSIKDAWNMPSVDVDATLIAIRIASFGHEMAFETKCPACGENNDHLLDLRVVLDSIKCPDYSEKVSYQDLKIKLCPQPYFGSNRGNAIQFEEQKLLQALENMSLSPEVKSAQINESMGRMYKLGLDTLVDSTEYIEMEDGTIISNRDHIFEYYDNANAELNKLLRAKLAALSEAASITPLDVNCTSCNHQYKIPLEFNYSSFFGKGF